MTRNAEKEAESILENARNSATQIREGIIQYTDGVLFDLQVQLKKINETLQTNRDELQNNKD